MPIGNPLTGYEPFPDTRKEANFMKQFIAFACVLMGDGETETATVDLEYGPIVYGVPSVGQMTTVINPRMQLAPTDVANLSVQSKEVKLTEAKLVELDHPSGVKSSGIRFAFAEAPKRGTVIPINGYLLF